MLQYSESYKEAPVQVCADCYEGNVQVSGGGVKLDPERRTAGAYIHEQSRSAGKAVSRG